MTYFLDFDRTLFDTDAFMTHLAQREDTRHMSHLPELDLAQKLNALVLSGELAFSRGELAPFVYADVPEFLRAAGNEATIITFGNPDLQRIKIESALHGIPRITAFYTGEVCKGPYLRTRIDAYREPLLVDDAPLELEQMQLCPSVRLFEMRRDGGAGDGRWPVIHSLTELP